ncbi:MAG: hypothetical protein MZU97_19490 [Bacillus subtilis]|nr:hypothetical protein [Bacillus subtilis]
MQPPWTDVTFFRMYHGPSQSQSRIFERQESRAVHPVRLDQMQPLPGRRSQPRSLGNIGEHHSRTIKSTTASTAPASTWATPCPRNLLSMIIQNAKKNDPDFAFIAEELNPDNAVKAKALGYNIIIGNGFWMEPRIWEKRFHKFVYGAKDVALPMFACAETHDTARIAGRDGGRVARQNGDGAQPYSCPISCPSSTPAKKSSKPNR